MEKAAAEVGLLNCPAIHDGAAQPSTPRDAERYSVVTTQSDRPELRAWLERVKWGHGPAGLPPAVRSQAALAELRRRPAADRRRSPR
jgi:hypothetical protein